MKYLSIYIFILIGLSTLGQSGGGDPATVNKLPDYIPPSPEAASLFKAEQLSVSYATGSPNISIPLGNLTLHTFSLNIDLGYSTTGIKVDDYASMVGMGFDLHYSGVVSRTVLGKPDESRSSTNNNLKAPSFLVQNQALLDFLLYAQDKESDVFTVTLPGVSGKFILDTLDQPVFLSNINCKIAVINSNFLNGFILTSDDGTAYHFEDAEISNTRNPTGTNCEKINDNTNVKTSWYLTKIVLPSTRKQINFTYTTSSVTSESSISQTISRVTASEQYNCGGSPTGYACPLGTERFSTCIFTQTITAKYVTKIETSDGDKAEFTYDNRDDLIGGKRLASIKITNRNNKVIRQIQFYGVYKTTVNSGTFSRSRRLFLDSLSIYNTVSSTVKEMKYRFKYIDYGNLPVRLSYGQDFYGYYNGNNSNASLIPILSSGDPNYSTFNNGTGTTSVNFGNRSIDTVYAIKGLLCRITYPTGGYDSLVFSPNKRGTGTLSGGNSVYKIMSYTAQETKALEKIFVYKYKSNDEYSAVAFNSTLRFSQVNDVKRDGYNCGGTIMCSGLQCTYAVVTSNTTVPLTPLGAQHLYHLSVLEYENGASGTNGMTEHKFTIFAGGNLGPQHLLNNYVLNAPYQVVPDVVIGEHESNIYKWTGSAYQLLKKKEAFFQMAGFSEYKNYSVKQNFTSSCTHNPPLSYDFEPFDVDAYYLNVHTVLMDSVIETDYSDFSHPLVNKQIFEYNFPANTYLKKITSQLSDGSQQQITKKYPQDYTAYNFMSNRNIVSPVVEERNYKNNILLSSTVNTYIDYFSNTKNIVLQSAEFKRDSTSQISKFLFTVYDTMNNVLELSKINDAKISYIWDYKFDYPVAKIINSSVANAAYTSFEADGKGNWGFIGSSVADKTSPTGEKCYYLPNGSVSKSEITSTKSYRLSYWSKNGSYTVSGGSGLIQGKTTNGWTYYQHTVTGVSSTTISGSGYVDELRLYPIEAQMTTYAYEPLIGMVCQCDYNNTITYFEYDIMGRLNLVRDQDRNVIKKFCYNYWGQPEDCEGVVFYNLATSQNFTRNNCGTGYIGSTVTYTVLANTYPSTVSQADADQQAANDITANGQNYANANGICTPVCNSSNCTGNDKKCISGICETGQKIITGTRQVHGGLWECTFYYQWSDNSTSQEYTEYYSSPCQID